MKYIRLVIALLCVTTFATAQKAVIPGYQGHRLAIEANYRTFWNYAASDGNFTAPYDGVSPGWFKEFGVSATYAISRRKSVQFGIERGRAAYVDGDYILVDPFQGAYSIDIADKINYTTLHASIYFNRRNSWAYAPVGPYWGLRVSYSLGKSTMDQYRGASGWQDISTLSVAAEDIKSYRFATPNIALPLGVRFIPFDRATIDLGILLTIPREYKEILYDEKLDLSPDEQQVEERRFFLYLTQGWRVGVSAGYLF